jgi:CrcB protein
LLNLLLIAVAGGLGALARYGLTGLVHRVFGMSLPWGTAVVNVLGCLVFGLIWGISEGRMGFQAEHRLIVLVGFVGSFTTFSTFIFEVGMQARDNQWLAVLGNMVGQNVIGVLALVAGLSLARLAQ